MLRFLADSQNYDDWLKGIDKLTREQMQVLYERLKAELADRTGKTNDTVDLKVESPVSQKEISKVIKAADKPTSPIECCLYCGSIRIKKHGRTKGGVTRYICKDCGKTFSENYGLITHYSHLSSWQLKEIVRGTISKLSITAIAKNIKVSTSTVWSYRLKIYQTILNIYGYCDTFNNIVEVDGTYQRLSFKGCKDKAFFIDILKRMPRHHRSRKERVQYLDSCNKYKELFIKNPGLLKEMIYHSQKRLDGTRTIDCNRQSVCILTAIDRTANMYLEPISLGTPNSTEIYNRLQGKLAKDAVLVTDEHKSYNYYARKEQIEHIKIISGQYVRGAYSLSRVNSLHSIISKFINKDNECQPATKYLDLYLMMIWFMQKCKDQDQLQLTNTLFNLITGHVDYQTRSKMEPITIESLNARELPIDTKGFF